MASTPYQPIPDKTQPHVDRLVGARVGGLEVGERVVEGRFGTLYQARQATTGREVTLEVLRAGLGGNDAEVRAVNAIKCAGVADVLDFGVVPDGRRFRVLERLDGESLEQRVLRGGPMTATEAAARLGQLAEVLQAAHAWALPHGSLGPSTVFFLEGGVKVIDFGLAKARATVEADLHALGALGFMLVSGQELAERPPASRTPGVPEPLDRLLRDLFENRVADATAARRAFARVSTLLEKPAAVTSPPEPSPSPVEPAPAPRRSRALVLVLAGVAVAGALAVTVGWWSSSTSLPPEPATPPTPPTQPPQAAPLEAPLQPDEGEELELDEAGALEPEPAGPRPSTAPAHRRSRAAPTAGALMQEIGRLESGLRRQMRPGDDYDQAFYVLNKQRLRLTGAPSEKDRRDVAAQLAAWRHSYLRR